MSTSTNGRRITTHEATVSTAQVEVKTLTIRGKQVTLAVYRQLIEEPLIDYRTVELRGVPWGTVNYHPGVCARPAWAMDDEHIHVVWQKGAELRRSAVFARRVRNAGAEAGAAMRVRQANDRGVALARAILCYRAHQAVTGLFGRGALPPTDASGQLYFISDGRPDGTIWDVPAPSEVYSFLTWHDADVTQRYAQNPEFVSRQQAITNDGLLTQMKKAAESAGVHEDPKPWVNGVDGKHQPSNWLAQLVTMGRELRAAHDAQSLVTARETNLQARYAELYGALKLLDQLFIAV